MPYIEPRKGCSVTMQKVLAEDEPSFSVRGEMELIQIDDVMWKLMG